MSKGEGPWHTGTPTLTLDAERRWEMNNKLAMLFKMSWMKPKEPNPPFFTSNPCRVRNAKIDIDQTLSIAEEELQCRGFTRALAFWGIRDQAFTPDQARRAGEMYLKYLDEIAADPFSLWHASWAVSNIYREGEADVKAAIEPAYKEAVKRATAEGGFASIHVNGALLCGDIHPPARAFVRSHTVALGASGYLQSLAEYKPCRT